MKRYKSGYIAILGKPNVGKSTLLNKILNIRLSITSPRPQTTRRRVMGIFNEPGIQAIFLDTPGMLKPRYSLQRSMMESVRYAAEESDVLLFITEMQSPDYSISIYDEDIEFLNSYVKAGKKYFIVINKIDLYSKNNILPVIEYFSQNSSAQAIIPVSALKNDGLMELKKTIRNILPEHPPYYDPAEISNQPQRFFISEFIREQIFYKYQQEIPYSTEILVEEYKERKKGKDYIRAIINVERQSQKGILIGRKGQALKEIGRDARKIIEKFLGKKVFLELFVKVSKDWRKDESQLKKFGYS